MTRARFAGQSARLSQRDECNARAFARKRKTRMRCVRVSVYRRGETGRWQLETGFWENPRTQTWPRRIEERERKISRKKRRRKRGDRGKKEWGKIYCIPERIFQSRRRNFAAGTKRIMEYGQLMILRENGSIKSVNSREPKLILYNAHYIKR